MGGGASSPEIRTQRETERAIAAPGCKGVLAEWAATGAESADSSVGGVNLT